MADTGPKLGVAALAADLDPRSLPLTGAAPQQLGLLADQAEAYEPATDSMPFPERRGPGRPKGAPNKRTADFARYIQSRYGDLLTGLAAVAFTPIEELARDLGCTKLEAFDRWLKVRAELLPYVHAKLPAEAVIKHEQLPTLVIGELHVGTGGAVQLGPEGLRAMSIGPSEQYQGVSLDLAAKSHDGQSHDAS
jgi:hypothetical protein